MESNLATPVDVARHEKRAGIFGDWTEADPAYKPTARPVASSTTATSIGIWKIAAGVFLGNLMFAALAGLLYVLFEAH